MKTKTLDDRTIGERIGNTVNCGSIIHLLLNDGYFIGRGSGDLGIEIKLFEKIPEQSIHRWRGPVKSLVGYYTGFELREYRGTDAIYISPVITPEGTVYGGGDFIEIPMQAINKCSVVQGVESKRALHKPFYGKAVKKGVNSSYCPSSYCPP